jgi:hypothetical protein
VSELRHDFRHYYHVSFDEVETEEAIDLIKMLPPHLCYRTALYRDLEKAEQIKASIQSKKTTQKLQHGKWVEV